MAAGLNLEELPSRKQFYNIFGGKTGTCEDKCKGSVEGALNMLSSGEENFKGKIYGAHNTASGMKADIVPYRDQWNFLYYWIVDQIWDKLPERNRDFTFESFVDALCKNMKTEYEKEGYNITCERISKKTFTNRKNVHDNSYDYDTVKGKLLKGWPDCDPHWLDYLKGVTASCKAVRTNCEAGKEYGKEHYCSNFNSKYQAHCDALEHLEQKFESQAKDEQLQACSSAKNELETQLSQKSSQLAQTESNLSKATTTTTLSSIFATLGLTVAPIILYKV